MRKRHGIEETENDLQKARKRARKEAKKIKKERNSMNSNDCQSPTTQSSSPWRQTKLSLVVSLFPSALSNVSQHLHESIRSMLLKYSDGMEGVLLAFDKVSIIGNQGIIRNELAHIHYTVQMNALIFSPTIGTPLTGVVNECFPSHVGMLVHSFFNAMVPAEQLEEAGYIFNQEMQQWIHETTNKIVKHDDSIHFTTEKLHECGGIISLEGSKPILS